MRSMVFPLVLAVLAVGCETAPQLAEPAAPTPAVSPSRTSVFPNLDGGFGPIVLAECEGGYDLLYQQRGTVTVIETTDGDGTLTRLRFVWDLTITVANSASGYALSGPSHGPDETTFNEDGSSRLVQYGLVGMLRPDGGAPLTVDAGRIEFLITEDGASIVSMAGPHPHHDGFPERPMLCELVNR